MVNLILGFSCYHPFIFSRISKIQAFGHLLQAYAVAAFVNTALWMVAVPYVAQNPAVAMAYIYGNKTWLRCTDAMLKSIFYK